MSGFTRLVFIVFSIAFASIIATSDARTKPKTPSLLLLPITKDELTTQYYTSLHVGTTPRSSLNVVLDLGKTLTWFNCRNTSSSSTYRLIRCPSSVCTSIPGAGCDKLSCLHRVYNPLNRKLVTGRVSQDRVSFYSSDGAKTLARVSVRRLTFLCAGPENLQGMAPAAAGVMGLAGGDQSFPAQVTSAFNIIRKYALCLPSHGTGHFYIGGGPYILPPYKESVSNLLTLTPLTRPGFSESYFISVKSISVDGNPISFNPSLLSISNKGNGGTKISTVDPYTVLHTDIYKALVQEFGKRAVAMGLRKAAAVAPFSDCYDSSTVRKSETGPRVPPIDLAVPGRIGNVTWRFYGANSMVQVNGQAMCLAFVDGGRVPGASVVLGTHQLQNYLLEFDLSTSVLGFSSSLLLSGTTCSNWAS